MYKRFCDICGKEITKDSDCAVLCTKIDRGTATLNGLQGRNKRMLRTLDGVEMCEECYGKFYDMYLSYKAERKGYTDNVL